MIYKHIITNVLIALVLSLPIILAEELNLIYDANGNLVTGDGIYREYNSLNQLWKVYNGSDTNGILLQEYMHEPGEERVLMKKLFNSSGHNYETVYYPFKELTRVVNSSGTYDFTNVYHEGQLIAVRHPDGTKEFYHPDHLGSTTLITDESGDVVEETEYSPFGVILSGGNSRYDYEGKEFDKITGAFDFHFRNYCAKWGKFCTPDTLIQNVYDPQSLNRYAFERNNPYKYTDPDGHIALTAAFAVVFAITVAVATVVVILDDYAKQDTTALAADGASEVITIAFEEVAPKAAGKANTVLGVATIVEALVVTYEDFTEDDEDDKNDDCCSKLKKITYVDENGQEIVLNVPESTNRLHVAHGKSGGSRYAVELYEREDGTIVWGDPDNTAIPDGATPVDRKEEKRSKRK